MRHKNGKFKKGHTFGFTKTKKCVNLNIERDVYSNGISENLCRKILISEVPNVQTPPSSPPPVQTRSKTQSLDHTRSVSANRNECRVFNMEGVKIEATDSDEKPDTTRVEDKETKVMEEKQEVEPNVSCQNEDMPDAESEMNTEETEPCAMDGIAVSLSTDEKTLLSDKLQDSNAEDLPTKTQFEQLLELCNEDYTICENHTAEMLEKNIVCKNCLQPMCALCLHQYHMGHSMISLVKLREIKKIKETLDKDVLALTEKQKFYKDESTIRNEKIVKIECEAKNIISGITQSFDQLVSVIEAKKKELCAHVLTFKNEQLNIINNELIQINEQQESILDLNEKMEAFYRSIDLKDAEKLPQRSGDILSKEVDYLHVAGDSWRPEKKYSKLLPSIQAVANICQTIRPEATKVVWWKVDSKKKERSDSSVDHPAKKRKIEPESPVMSHGSDQQTSPTGSEKHSTPPSGRVLRNSTEAPDSTCLWQDSSYDANEGDKEEEPAEDVNFACVDFDANGMTVGKKILVNGHLDNLWIGEVVDTRRLKSEKLFSVKWCSGIVGKQKSFQIGERWQSKGDTAHTACVVCHFDLDLSQPLSEDLEKVLLKAREEKERLDRIEKAQSRRVSRSSSRRKR